MAILEILKWPDPRLAQTCDPVLPSEDMTQVVADMFETMYAAPGRGLAGPQVGVMKRVFVTDTTWKDGPGTPIAFLNPVITDWSETMAVQDEGCLSIPGLMVPVERPDWVQLTWNVPTGQAQTARFEGFAAACVQHELDHLDGRITFDHLNATDRNMAEAKYRTVPA